MKLATPIIFLDFDGVLNSEQSDKYNQRIGRPYLDFCPICLSNFQYILEQIPDARIVISSSWRNETLDSELLAILTRNHIDITKVIGVTPIIPREDHYVTRAEEIGKYIETNKLTRYVILDDVMSMGIYSKHFVHTYYRIGLTIMEAEKAIRILESSY